MTPAASRVQSRDKNAHSPCPDSAAAPDKLKGMRWQDYLRAEPDPPRRLTLTELRRLHHLGFEQLARDLASGICPKCRMRTSSRFHRDTCLDPAAERRNPLPAYPEPAQPWEPRPASRAA